MQGSPSSNAMHTCFSDGMVLSVVRNLTQEEAREYWREIDWFAPHEEDGLAGYLFAEDAELRGLNS